MSRALNPAYMILSCCARSMHANDMWGTRFDVEFRTAWFLRLRDATARENPRPTPLPGMALQPPDDFAPAAPERDPPSEDELRALWERHEAAHAERERSARWRRATELLRREADGDLSRAHGAAGGGEAEACGPRSRAALRPAPAEGRVLAAGIDTWSP